MKHQRKSTRRPITPSNPSIGLDSALNRDYVLQILARSTQEDVEWLLRKAGFRPSNATKRPISSSDRAAAMEREAAAYIRTPEGARQRAEKIEEMLRRTATEWARSADALEKLRLAKAALLAKEAARDLDLYTKACADALAERVSVWLRSPLGQAQLEQEKQRVLRREAEKVASASTGTSWVQRQLEGMRDA